MLSADGDTLPCTQRRIPVLRWTLGTGEKGSVCTETRMTPLCGSAISSDRTGSQTCSAGIHCRLTGSWAALSYSWVRGRL
jgi:hypothetical protein